MIIYTCPKCGHDLLSEVLTCLPPIHRDYCPNCGWRHEESEEVVRIPYGGNSNITESTLNSIELKTDMCCDSVASIDSTITIEEVCDLLGEETVLKIEEALTEIFDNKLVDLNNPNFTDEDIRNLFVGDENNQTDIDALLCEIGKIPESENKENEIISMDTFKAVGLISDIDNCEPSICLANVNIANTTGRKCPHCGKSYYTELYGTSTAVYYQPIYKNGVNINPDRNQTTTVCECLNCGKTFCLKQ